MVHICTRNSKSIKMASTKINISIGVLIGALCGFVFGAVYSSSGAKLNTSGNLQGNIAQLPKLRHSADNIARPQNEYRQNDSQRDTIKYTLTDENGAIWNITMTK